jgi:hypothetical protein
VIEQHPSAIEHYLAAPIEQLPAAAIQQQVELLRAAVERCLDEGKERDLHEEAPTLEIPPESLPSLVKASLAD